MLRRVWQALNCLFIHATYCVIVSGASPGETGCTDSQGADHSHSNVSQRAGTDPCTTSGSAFFRCSDARRSSHTHRTGPSRFFCCCSIHLELSTCWDSTMRKHSHFKTPLENPSIQTHLVLPCCIKRLCIFGPIYKSVIIIIINKQKCGLRYVKTAIFVCTCGSNNWETVEDRCVDAARQFVSIEFSFHPYSI